MSTVLIIAIFLLAITSFALYRSKRTSSRRGEYQLPPPRRVSLFEAEDTNYTSSRQLEAETESAGALAERRAVLRARAESGDTSALAEAHDKSGTAGDEFYDELLDALVSHTSGSDERLHALASFVVENKELPANKSLTDALMRSWEVSPDAASTGELLHVAALSGDAATFGQVVEKILRARRAGKLSAVSAQSLCDVIESEFWVLPSEEIRSGAGFTLKQNLAEVRRRLLATAGEPAEHETASQTSD